MYQWPIQNGGVKTKKFLADICHNGCEKGQVAVGDELEEVGSRAVIKRKCHFGCVKRSAVHYHVSYTAARNRGNWGSVQFFRIGVKLPTPSSLYEKRKTDTGTGYTALLC